MTAHEKTFWLAVASWLRKEAAEALKRHPMGDEPVTVDIFAGLARSIDYGVKSVELAEGKDALFNKRSPDAA